MPKPKGRTPDNPVKAAIRAVVALSPEEREDFQARLDDLMENLAVAVQAEINRLHATQVADAEQTDGQPDPGEQGEPA